MDGTVVWVAERDGEELAIDTDWEVAKEALLDALELEACRAMDHHDEAARREADDAWAMLEISQIVQSVDVRVNGSQFVIRATNPN